MTRNGHCAYYCIIYRVGQKLGWRRWRKSACDGLEVERSMVIICSNILLFSWRDAFCHIQLTTAILLLLLLRRRRWANEDCVTLYVLYSRWIRTLYIVTVGRSLRGTIGVARGKGEAIGPPRWRCQKIHFFTKKTAPNFFVFFSAQNFVWGFTAVIQGWGVPPAQKSDPSKTNSWLRGLRVTLDNKVWVLKIPPWNFLTFFPKRLGIFSPKFKRPLGVPIYAGLQMCTVFNYLQLWRSYAILSTTNIMCWKIKMSIIDRNAHWVVALNMA